MVTAFRQYYAAHPLRTVLLVGLSLRLLVSLLSPGYGMHDDHFLVIEVAQSWAEGGDVAHWIVDDFADNTSGRSILYPGLHFLLFWLLDAPGLSNPALKMLLVRIIHAVYSVLGIYLAYLLTRRLSSQKAAITVAWICACFWLLAAWSVRNLVELVAIPPLIYSCLLLIDIQKGKKHWLRASILAGAMLSLCFSLRYQTLLFTGGVGLAVLLLKQWRVAPGITLGFLIPFCLIHGLLEYYLCGRPFGKVIYYIDYNLNHATSYITLPWYNYIILFCGTLIPPLGLLLFAGNLKVSRDRLIPWLGAALFFTFHSYFPNKQERFVFTIIPVMISLGLIGYQELAFGPKGKAWMQRLLPVSLRIFGAMSLIGFIIMGSWYHKRARIEAMRYLAQYENLDALVVENQNEGGTRMLPRFYLQQWPEVYNVARNHHTPESLKKALADDRRNPEFVLFEILPNETLAEERLNNMRRLFPMLSYKETVVGSWQDRLLYQMNPNNKNYEYAIYSTGL